MARLSDDSHAPGEPTLTEPRADPGDLARPAHEALEDWLLRTESVRALGLYVGTLVLAAGVGWALVYFVGMSWWVVAAALAIVLAGLATSLVTRSWSRVGAGAGVALGALALGTAAYLGLGAQGIGPAASLIASGQIRTGERIAVLEFTAAPADSTLARAAAELARIGLRQSPVVVGAPANARSPHSLALSGDLARAGAGLALRLRLVRDATVLASVHDELDAPDEIIAAVNSLVRALRRRIGEPPGSIRRSEPLEQAVTASLPAMEAYARAMHLALADAPQLAVAPARRAVALDSGFALARLLLSDMLIQSGAATAAVDSSLDATYRMRDRLPERMRLALDVAYYTFPSRRDRGRAIRALETMLRHGDTTPRGPAMLATLLVSRRDYAGAEVVAQRAVAIDSTAAPNYEPLLASLAAQSKMTALQGAVERLRRNSPAQPLAVLAPIELAYVNGDYDAASAQAESLRAAPDSAVRVRAAALLTQLELLRGHVGTWLRAHRDAAPQRPASPVRALMDSALFAFADAWYFGHNERAVQRLDSALAALPLDGIAAAERPSLRLATVYAMAGNATRARRLIDHWVAAQDSVVARQSRPVLHRALGEVALAEGRPTLAIVEFYRADSLDDGPAGDPLQTMVDLGRAFNDANEPDSAIVWLERFVNTTRWSRDSIDAIYLPRVHELLAELYDTKGDGPRAMSHYGRFANLWHAADPELMPLVTSARRRLTELAREDRP